MAPAIRVREYRTIPVRDIRPDGDQPRRDFAKDALRRLAESLRAIGQIEDIVVRESDHGYQLVAGERRWRAAQLAELSELAAKVVEIDDDRIHAVQLAENIHRENLTDVRLAFVYRDLLRRGQDEEAIAQDMNLPRRDIAEKLSIIDRNTLIDLQQNEIEHLQSRVESLEHQVELLKLQLGRSAELNSKI